MVTQPHNLTVKATTDFDSDVCLASFPRGFRSALVMFAINEFMSTVILLPLAVSGCCF